MEMTLRKGKILSSVISEYVTTGEPVGSKIIAEAIGVSSATVRNEMAELIELGFLEQPHTSAGRVPSQKGYREYVDRLMVVPELKDEEKRYLDSVFLSDAHDRDRFISGIPELLSGITGCVSAVTTPGGSAARILAVQFVQLSRRNAMLILLGSAGIMKNEIFRCEFDLSADMLRIFFRIFNERLTGKRISDITPAFLQTFGVSLGDIFPLAGAPLAALMNACRSAMEAQPVLSGQMNLLLYPEFGLSGVRKIAGVLQDRKEMSQLLIQKPGKISVMIGTETGKAELSDTSVLVSRYKIGDHDAGALAIIGPMRMNYAKLISVLKYLTQQVDSTLAVLMSEE